MAMEMILVGARTDYDGSRGEFRLELEGLVYASKEAPDTISALYRATGGHVVLMSKAEYEDLLTLGTDDA